MTLRRKIWLLRQTIRLLWAFRRSIIRKSFPKFKKIEEWAEDWISQGYQVHREEKVGRFIRLSRAAGLLHRESELRQLYQDLEQVDKTRNLAGKTRGRRRK